MKINVPQNLQKLAKIFGKKTDLFIVGGYVRDQILSLSTNDVDICSSLTISQVQTLLNLSKYSLKDVNKKLGTAKILCENEIYEYSTFRKEVYENSGDHCPIEVQFIKSVEEDSRRRDFTVNCIYYNINQETIIDFYNGIEDIKHRRMRCVETPNFVFNNDGVRILRLARQASQLNFSVTNDTLLIAKRMSYKVKDISNQRKLDELMLLLDCSNKYKKAKQSYMKGLKLFNFLELWEYYFPELQYVSYKMVRKVEPSQRFIGLLIDIVNSVNPDCVSYYLEKTLGSKGLGLPKSKLNKDIEIVCGYFDALNMLNNKDYFFTYFSSFDQISKVLEKHAPLIHRKYNFFYKYIIKYKVPIQIKDLKINGNDLKQNFPKLPEKRYKYILTDLLNKVFRAEIDNTKDCLLAEVKNYDI